MNKIPSKEILDYMRANARRGGLATKKKHPNHFSEMGLKGVEARKAKRLSTAQRKPLENKG